MLRIKILPAILLVASAAVGAAVVCSTASAADECRKSPGANASAGMHWYYRINHATHAQCWYLGPVGAHVSAHVGAGARESAAPREAPDDTADADAPAAPPPPQPQRPNVRSPAFMPASAGFVAPVPQVDFTARWPGDLPSAPDLSDSEPATASDSFAEPSAPADATAQAPQSQMPKTWPVDDSRPRPRVSAGEIVLAYFSLAGCLAIPVLLVAGWAAKFVRAPRRLRLAKRLRALGRRRVASRARVGATGRTPAPAKARRSEAMPSAPKRTKRSAGSPRSGEARAADPRGGEPRRDRPQLGNPQLGEPQRDEPQFGEPHLGEPQRHEPYGQPQYGEPGAGGRADRIDRTDRMDGTWRPLTPTDPAHDLKTSLAELMRDLRRAAASEDGSLGQPIDPRRRTLEAAE